MFSLAICLLFLIVTTPLFSLPKWVTCILLIITTCHACLISSVHAHCFLAMNLAALLQQKVIVIYISVHILQHIAK